MTDPVQFIPSGRKLSAKLLDAVTTPQVSGILALSSDSSTIQASIAGTGAVTATLLIEYSNDNVGWIPAGSSPTISLSGTNADSDGYKVDASWVYKRATLLTISGTGAAVTVTVACNDG